MPTYEYECSDCGASIERWQRFSDVPLTECPTCSGSLHRVISPVGVIFKGSGWYCTDHRSNGNGRSNGKSADHSESSSSGDSSTKSDSSAKSESKTPAGAAA